MLAWFVTIAVVLAALGAGLIVIGVRGRRVDKHPICAACGFDLVGRFPWGTPTAPTCPDCGTPLLTPASVRPGARRRRSHVLTAGMMLAFPALLMLALIGADRLGLVNAARIMPPAQLLAQASGPAGQPGRGDPRSIQRLYVKYQDGTLEGPLLAGTFDAALAAEADRATERNPLWTALLEKALKKGELSPARQQAMFRGGLSLNVSTRTQLAKGQPFPFGLIATFDRLPQLPAGQRTVTVALESIAVDGGPETKTGEGGAAGLATEVSMNAAPGAHGFWMATATTRMETGVHQLAMRWRCRVTDQSGATLAVWYQETSTRVSVGGASAAVSFFRDEGTARRLTELLRPSELLAWVDADGQKHLRWSMAKQQLPADVLGFLALEDYEPNTPKPVESGLFSLIQNEQGGQKRWTQEWLLRADLNPGEVTLVIKPLPREAETGTLATEIWAGRTLRLVGVPVRWVTPKEAEAMGEESAGTKP